jgi:hypothetical protein
MSSGGATEASGRLETRRFGGNLNLPEWKPTAPSPRGGFYEVWYLRLNDPLNRRALWLRFSLLVTANGFRRVAETWAVHFERGAGEEVAKTALKQTFGIEAFQALGDHGIRIGDCEFTEGRTRGSISSKGRTLKWDLEIIARQKAQFNHVPDSLARAGLVRSAAVTPGEDLLFRGTTELDGRRTAWDEAYGMQGHLSGRNHGLSWVWGHCNSFTDEKGSPAYFVFEGVSARSRILGPLSTPKLSSLYFFYKGEHYRFNSVWDALRLRSRNTLTSWQFQADRGDLVFKGELKAEIKGFAGVTYEDTSGSFLYCANSELSDLEILVYRRGKLDATFRGKGTAALEVVTRTKNPYVPLLI